MTLESFLKGQIAAHAIHEGFRHGGVENMIAVAQVLRNRYTSGWQGGDWMRILEAAEGHAGTLYPREAARIRDTQIRLFLQRLDDVFTGNEEDHTNGALFYCELHNLNGTWFKANVLAHKEDHRQVAKIGPVTFFS